MARFYACEIASIAKAVDYVKKNLEAKKADPKVIAKTLLRLEDVIGGVIRKAKSPHEKFRVSILRLGLLGKIRITVRCRGAMVTVDDVVPSFEYEGLEPETIQLLNKRLKPLRSKGLSLKHRMGINTATIKADAGKISRLALNLLTMVSAVLLGVLLRNVLAPNAVTFVATEVFGTISTLFFNLLKMIVAPLVFFSIVTSVSGFSDIGELGTIGVKTVLLFVFFSIIGLLIGFGLFQIIPSGDPAIQAMLDCPDTVAAAGSTSSLAWQNIKSFLMSIFPANMLGAFVENNVLGVIFIALLAGVGISKMQPEKAVAVNRAVDVGNELIMKITATITGFMPVLIFSSLAKLAMSVNVSLLGTLARYLGAIALGFLLMVVFYMIALAVKGINPFAFLKGFGPAIFTGFTLSSSTATVPASLDCCVNNLKIPPAITYFVIPLGSTINMNGSCIMLLITCLFLTNVFAIPVTFVSMIPVMLMLLLLAMAAPGVPGSMVIMLATVLPVIGVPAEAANVTLWFSSLVGMMMVPVNSMGDAVTAAIVSRDQEKKKKAEGEDAEEEIT